MAICPRRSGGASVDTSNQGTATVELNGTLLGGSLMVKGEPEYVALKTDSKLLDRLLLDVGLPVS